MAMIGQRTPYSPNEEESVWMSLGWNSDGPSALMQQISTNENFEPAQWFSFYGL
jgi:hypothetical protein